MRLRVHVEAAIDFPDEEARLPRRRAHCRGARDARAHSRPCSRRRAAAGAARRPARRHRRSAERRQVEPAQRARRRRRARSSRRSPAPRATSCARRSTSTASIHVVDTAGLRATDDVDRSRRRQTRAARARAARTSRSSCSTRRAAPPGCATTTPRSRRRSIRDAEARAAEQVRPLPGPRGRARCGRCRLPSRSPRATARASPQLRERLKLAMPADESESGAWSARRRHLDALGAARKPLPGRRRPPRGARVRRAPRGRAPPGAPGARRSHRRLLERRAAGRGLRDLLHRQVGVTRGIASRSRRLRPFVTGPRLTRIPPVPSMAPDPKTGLGGPGITWATKYTLRAAVLAALALPLAAQARTSPTRSS